ncbi:uncharacterized protein [Temnothorax nylanderi]|uniref:uncharacterized protein n=1 Tax=Temnothorax nylanderi TaxID=102681 RepID=UPI003A8C620E
MRSIICILALLCTVYALEQNVTDPSRNLERLVKIRKAVTEATFNNILRFERRTKQNLEIELNELKIDALLDIHNTINEAFENVDSSVDKGTEEGKNVDECDDYARNNLETKNTNAIAKLEACIENGYSAMKGPLANVASSIEAVKKLLIDLDAIMPNCYSPSFFKMQACVVEKIDLSRASLDSVSNNAKEVTATAGVTYTKMIVDVRSGITTNAADIRTFSTDIVNYTDNCIRNAPEVPEDPELPTIF